VTKPQVNADHQVNYRGGVHIQRAIRLWDDDAGGEWGVAVADTALEPRWAIVDRTLMVQGFQGEGYDEADPLTVQYLKELTAHELGHACDANHHHWLDSQNFDLGEVRCLMLYKKKFEQIARVRDLFCTTPVSPDRGNCLYMLRIKDW